MKQIFANILQEDNFTLYAISKYVPLNPESIVLLYNMTADMMPDFIENSSASVDSLSL